MLTLVCQVKFNVLILASYLIFTVSFLDRLLLFLFLLTIYIGLPFGIVIWVGVGRNVSSIVLQCATLREQEMPF